MDIHGYPWESMNIHAYPWISIEEIRLSMTPLSCKRKDIHCTWRSRRVRAQTCLPRRFRLFLLWRTLNYPWISKDTHGYPCVSMGTHGYPWISMDMHGYPRIAMGMHGYPWISMEQIRLYMTPPSCKREDIHFTWRSRRVKAQACLHQCFQLLIL